MPDDFKVRLQIIYQQYQAIPESGTLKSVKGFADFLGLSKGKVHNWFERGNIPSAHDLKLIHDKLGFAYEWLLTGEGEPEDPFHPLHHGHGQLPASREAKDLAQENQELQTELADLRGQMIALQRELIAAQKELLELQRDKAVFIAAQQEAALNHAPGAPSAGIGDRYNN